MYFDHHTSYEVCHYKFHSPLLCSVSQVIHKNISQINSCGPLTFYLLLSPPPAQAVLLPWCPVFIFCFSFLGSWGRCIRAANPDTSTPDSSTLSGILEKRTRNNEPMGFFLNHKPKKLGGHWCSLFCFVLFSQSCYLLLPEHSCLLFKC